MYDIVKMRSQFKTWITRRAKYAGGENMV